ncbi:MAG: hypothetical protein K6G50_07435 [bacterium]|nr:hypothetical protein [bacterium]
MDIHWEDGFTIKVSAENEQVVISANREGLLSLANILKALADQEPGGHVHLDEYNSLEENSAELVIEKI